MFYGLFITVSRRPQPWNILNHSLCKWSWSGYLHTSNNFATQRSFMHCSPKVQLSVAFLYFTNWSFFWMIRNLSAAAGGFIMLALMIKLSSHVSSQEAPYHIPHCIPCTQDLTSLRCQCHGDTASGASKMCTMPPSSWKAIFTTWSTTST